MQAYNRKNIQDKIDQASPNPNGKTTKTYRFGDGGLLLQVTGKGVKSWVYRYTINYRTRVIGLGSARTVAFEEASKRARKVRVSLDEGVDPLMVRDQQKSAAKAERSKRVTFRECAEAYLEEHKEEWGAKSLTQWSSSLGTYAYPVLGDMPIQDIGVVDVRRVIEPIWRTKNETCSRLISRMARIFSKATILGLRTGQNPAQWDQWLSEVLPKRSAVSQVKHFPSLPYSEVPEFFSMLETLPNIGSAVMRFLILTASRTTEARAAEWCEIDMEQRLWSIPADRMKARKPHRVPLSTPAMDILRFMKALNEAKPTPSKYVFPGQKEGMCPSEAAMTSLLKRINRRDIVPHGFRSTARVFFAECTDFPREVAEAVLAHQVKDKVEAAYQRGDYLDKRRVLMDIWAAHCVKTSKQSTAMCRDLPPANSVL